MSGDRESLRGSIVPLVTPFADGRVDYEGFELAVDRQALAGSQGVVVSGTTGEPTSLSLAERGELFRRAVAVAAGADRRGRSDGVSQSRRHGLPDEGGRAGRG